MAAEPKPEWHKPENLIREAPPPAPRATPDDSRVWRSAQQQREHAEAREHPRSLEDKVEVRFFALYPPYNKDECAAFFESDATELVDADIAELTGRRWPA